MSCAYESSLSKQKSTPPFSLKSQAMPVNYQSCFYVNDYGQQCINPPCNSRSVCEKHVAKSLLHPNKCSVIDENGVAKVITPPARINKPCMYAPRCPLLFAASADEADIGEACPRCRQKGRSSRCLGYFIMGAMVALGVVLGRMDKQS